MVISESMVAAKAESSYQKTTVQNLRLVGASTSSTASKAKTAGLNTQLYVLQQEKFDQVIFTETNDAQNQKPVNPNGGRDSGGVNSLQEVDSGFPESLDELKESLIKRMMEALTGKHFDIDSVYKHVRGGRNHGLQRGSLAAPRRLPMTLSAGTLRMETAEVETQSVSYSAKGMVKTADGKTIDFDLNMSMSQSTATYMSSAFNLAPVGKAVDPLIINYAGTASSLTETKFDFDLDADGVLDKISFAGEGSGFLALDKNGDGVINNGNELFGPQSGNGFDELRKYDKDNNGWIDEADEIYSQLKIWSKDENGNDVMYTLKELDVGAIYLNDSKTDYTMYDSAGNAQGEMRSTSFFLKDSGGAGFVSHFDLYA